MGVILSVFLLLITFQFTRGGVTLRTSQYVFKVKEENKLILFRRLSDYDLKLCHQITPSTYIFEYVGPRKQETISEVKQLYRTEIIEVEEVRVYENTLKPEATWTVENTHKVTQQENISHNFNNDSYYGMEIPKAWAHGYNGEGVTIAVTDVGVNTDLLDLKDNINNELSFNFVTETKDVTPEFFHNLQDKTSALTDHGNRVASMVAAKSGNGLCSSGISYNAKVVVLKIYQVKLHNGQMPVLEPNHWTASDIISRALVHGLDDIDIYANAWAPTKHFDTLDLATREAIVYSAENGRHGLGTVHVVPSGPPGNGLANNIHTITVNGMGIYGTISAYSKYIDASVLTSGLGDGQNLTAFSMVTTTLKNRCITSFKGVSAATAQIPAIIGLAIQANPNVSLRDVQHLVVQGSEHKGLKESGSFRPNGAGRYFHRMFGFGLLNADKLVTLAERHSPVPKLFSKKLAFFKTRSYYTQTYNFCHSCGMHSRHNCLASIEHVVLRMNVEDGLDDIFISLTSPQETESVLLDLKSYKGPRVQKLKLTSVHFWDEMAFGIWRLNVTDYNSYIGSISLTLYGTVSEDITSIEQLPEDMCENYTSSGKIFHIDRQMNNTRNISFETLFKLLLIAVPFSIVFDIILSVCIKKHKCRRGNEERKI